MKIDRIILRELRMSLLSPFETSFGRTTDRRVILVEVESEGVSGWGEVPVKPLPLYNEEFVDASWFLLRDGLAPRLLESPVAQATEVAGRLHFIRGHRMTRAGLETATWDLEAKRLGKPLWRHIGGSREEIDCGVSIGVKSTVDELAEQIERELADGYQRIKMKIKPGWDVDVVRAIRERFPDTRLMADANSAYRIADAERLSALDELDLMMIEQPLAHDDILDHAEFQKRLKTPICLDESILSARHAEQAVEQKACGVINIKLSRAGGYNDAILIHDVARMHHMPVWCGGMLETGVGRAHNIALSTLENFTLPGDVSASKRYFERDLIDPAVEVTNRGTILVSEKPGIGYDLDLDYIEALTVRREELR